MSAALHLAKPEDAGKLLPLVARMHEETGFAAEDAHRENAVSPLLEGSPHGAIWLIGPRRAPLGYAAVSFGWSLELGGPDARLDELYVRPSVRGRGIATEALLAIARGLRDAGLVAISLEVDRTSEAHRRLYERTGYELRDRFALMTARL